MCVHEHRFGFVAASIGFLCRKLRGPVVHVCVRLGSAFGSFEIWLAVSEAPQSGMTWNETTTHVTISLPVTPTMLKVM